METSLEWLEMMRRLGPAIIAGAVIGLDRSDQGHPAGLRTNILVCLAAATSMVLADLFFQVPGNANESMAKIDPMRLPLGVLSGMGFIGAGAILRRGQMITGVTTAATLWYVTMMGLVFGSGEVAFGFALLLTAIVVLKGFKFIEGSLPLERHATLRVVLKSAGSVEDQIIRILAEQKFRVQLISMSAGLRDGAEYERLVIQLKHRVRDAEIHTPPVIRDLQHIPGVVRLSWHPERN